MKHGKLILSAVTLVVTAVNLVAFKSVNAKTTRNPVYFATLSSPTGCAVSDCHVTIHAIKRPMCHTLINYSSKVGVLALTIACTNVITSWTFATD